MSRPARRGCLMRRICLTLAALVCWGLAPCFAAEATLIEFAIDDQFEREHTSEDLAGRVVLVIGGDRGGSKFTEDWALAIRSELGLEKGDEPIVWLTVANTKGVPFFLKGMVRGKFPKEPERRVLMDWKGRFAKAYEWVEDEANILVFDTGGMRMLQMHGTGVVVESVERVCEALRDVLRDE